jgi:hypothetical protein
MHDIDRSVIATLAYYGALNRPLTFMELAGRLTPSRRLGGRSGHPDPSQLAERLDVLLSIGTIDHSDGLYRLAGGDDDFSGRRIEQEKIWAQKWRRMLRRARWLQAAPFVRTLCASGSLAGGTAGAGSDWDVFIIAAQGRLYTARAFLLLSAWLAGALRRKGQTRVSDKFCFNHYMTTAGLASRHRSIFTAHSFALMVPIYDRDGYFGRFLQANRWIGDYRPMPVGDDWTVRSVRRSVLADALKGLAELVLGSPVGWPVEYILKAWQRRRIMRNPVTYEKGGRIIADDKEIEFHPRSFEATLLNRYNDALGLHGLGGFGETDSGLVR